MVAPIGDSAQVIRLLNAGKQTLVIRIGISEKLVMIDLDNERNFVGVFAGNGSQHAQGGGNGIAAAFNRQLDNIFRIEIDRVGCKGCPGGMLDPLIDRQNG